jgi:hypothetical protein
VTLAPKSPMTVAFCGSGSLSASLTGKLLDDFVGQNEFFGILPKDIKSKRSQEGLNHVWSWLDTETLQYDQEDPSDFLAKLAVYRNDGDDCYLVVAFDPAADDDLVRLITEAIDAGFRVLDLCKQLDDIVLEEEKPEVPPAEPERPSRRRTGGRARSTTPEPAKSLSEPPDEAQAETTTMVMAGAGILAPQDTDDSDALLAAVMLGIKALIKEEVALQLRMAPGAHSRDEQAAAERRMVDVLASDDGDYRLAAEGRRKRRGETKTEITEDEARKVLSPEDQEAAGL